MSRDRIVTTFAHSWGGARLHEARSASEQKKNGLAGHPENVILTDGSRRI